MVIMQNFSEINSAFKWEKMYVTLRCQQISNKGLKKQLDDNLFSLKFVTVLENAHFAL